MKTISLGLLRAAYPDLKSEQILSLQEIIVEKLGIEVLDGLEIFDDLISIRLAHNNIQVVENVDLLFRLEVLDLSHNCIESIDWHSFPSSLRVLKLVGNPCAKDIVAMNTLIEQLPNVEIITGDTSSDTDPFAVDGTDAGGVVEGEKGLGLGFGDVNGPQYDDDAPPSTFSIYTNYTPLDADMLLKDIVDRKIRLQNEKLDVDNMLDINQATSQLEEELSNTISSPHKRKSKIIERGGDGPSVSFASRIGKLKVETLSQKLQSSKDGDDFIARMRATVTQGLSAKEKFAKEIPFHLSSPSNLSKK
jgi:hypothetical protein